MKAFNLLVEEPVNIKVPCLLLKETLPRANSTLFCFFLLWAEQTYHVTGCHGYSSRMNL